MGDDLVLFAASENLLESSRAMALGRNRENAVPYLVDAGLFNPVWACRDFSEGPHI
jgi:hypothetical protein